MATNNAALYGVGKGDAGVYDTSGIDNAFQQLLARKQAQRQQEIKQLTDQQAQLRPEGLRNDAERQKYFNGVNDWRNLSIQAQNEKDPYKKSLLKSQADQRYLGLQSFVSGAKQAAKTEDAFGSQLLNPAVRDRYTEDAVAKYLANKNLSHDDPNFIRDFNSLEQQADHSKVLDRIDKANKVLLDQAQWGTPVLVRKKVGNRDATFINNSRTVSPQQQAHRYGQMYEGDREFKKMLMDIHPEIYNDPNLTPQQQKEAAIGALIKNQGTIAEYKAPQEKVDQAPDRFYEHYNYEHRNDFVPTSNPQDLTLPYNGGRSNVAVKNYVPLSLPSKNFAGQAAYDLTNGRQIPSLESSDAYSVVGVGNFPFIKGGYGKLNGTIAQPNFEQRNPGDINQRPMVHVQKKLPDNMGVEDYLVDYNKLPENIKNSKPVKQALAAFQPANNNSQVSKPTINQKQPTSFTIKGKTYKQDAVSKAAQASGMTVDEYLKEVNK